MYHGSFPPRERSVACGGKSVLLLTALAEKYCLLECRETDEYVYDVLECRHTAKEQVHNIQVLAEEAAKADETPVNASNEDQDEDDLVHGAFAATATRPAAAAGISRCGGGGCHRKGEGEKIR